MNRKEFLGTLGIGVAAVAIGSCLDSCKKTDIAPANIDFTIDLKDSAYAALKTAGGTYIYNKQVIVARTTSNTVPYLAVSITCPHAGTFVGYDQKDNVFICPAHGSIFGPDGGLLQGPAGNSLRAYKTDLIGSSLHVHS